MKDLIERLRDIASKGVSVWGDLQMEAADAIEKLEAENAALKAELAAIRKPFATMRCNEDSGVTFSGTPTGVIFKAGDTFTLYAAPGAKPATERVYDALPRGKV